ncbi:MAG: aminoacyl-tRNA hydrolase [Bacteroidetes bacterium]|nr:aminoacyl-tRNA hydrolase [Bacteroidota bacterium]
MKLIAGLGNPGTQYALTRHNIGFIILDYFADFLKINFKPGKGDFYFAQGKFRNEDFFLLKPVTFMNNSGLALEQFSENYVQIENTNDILVVHDDFHLPLGTIRVRTNGSDAGHNGVASVIYHLNSDEFARMRAGIGKNEVLRKDEYVEFVLTNFTDDETGKIKELLPVYRDCLLSFLTDDIKITMNKFNKNFLPDEPEPENEPD